MKSKSVITQNGLGLGAPPCSEFLAWSHEAGYSTCTSDIQLALWDAWQAGRKTARDLITMWEMTLRNRNGITWNEMDAGDTLRLRKSIDELRAVIIPNVPSDLSLLAFGIPPAREADQQEVCRKSRRDRD